MSDNQIIMATAPSWVLLLDDYDEGVTAIPVVAWEAEYDDSGSLVHMNPLIPGSRGLPGLVDDYRPDNWAVVHGALTRDSLTVALDYMVSHWFRIETEWLFSEGATLTSGTRVYDATPRRGSRVSPHVVLDGDWDSLPEGSEDMPAMFRHVYDHGLPLSDALAAQIDQEVTGR